MELFLSPTSPYARKVRVVLREKGLTDRVQETVVNPYRDPSELLGANPIGKIPTLVRDDGPPLYDSRVVCEWLDALAPEPGLLPAAGEARWTVRRAEAHADGILDLVVAIVMERARPDGEQSPAQIERWRTKVERAVDAIDDLRAALPDALNLGQIALAVTLGYLDLRLPELDWRAGRDGLAEWYAAFAARAAMRETAPPAQ